ncbi:MAG: hypothetical protein ACK5N4_19440 [Parabacteroides gordonii]|uniref:hypothetical protein n=1 Tax=Parabacteroides TaxID=375288 RepID=UPI0006171E70|nr:hypothetical protein [Parabacteroides sp. HGS0025]KKB53173.1 hypothetical protein HMPREF1212_01336 [Parabacteroides sp. HGS0025]
MNTKSIFLLCMWLFATCFLQAQDKMPQAVSYQAVARDAQGKVVAQKPIGIQVEILKGSTTGTVVFSETHSPTSSKTGTVNLLIGQGTRKTGTFSSVDWGADTYYLQLSMDLTGGSNYEKVSTTQMLPVPYALYAAKAGTVENGGESGNGSGNIAKFVIMSDDDAEELTKVLRGDIIEEEANSIGTGYFSFEPDIIYLDGTDQELDAVIENWPAGTKIGDSYGTEDEPYGEHVLLPSTSMWHHCLISAYNIPKGTHELKMLIKNKYGTILKEYPFTLKIIDRKYE